ncbi:MAG: hypothetical protein NC405_05385 [Odoribacter sp.]|nr:hypothetical protein [Odoribacter sp.]
MKQLLFKSLLGALALGGSLSVSAQVAQIGETDYETLTEAFVAAEAGQTITLLKDCEATALISVDKEIVFDLNGYELTNNVTGSRLFRLSGVNFTIENGKITTPETNTGSYGIVDFRDPSNVASPDANLTVKDVIVSGDTDDGSMFAIRTNGQTITLDNVTATMPGKTLNYSILNAYNLQVNATINGGTFEHGSTRKSMPAFQFGRNSNFTINGSKVISHSGPVFEASACTGVVTDCDMVCDNTSGNFNDACVAVSNGSDVTVKGGTYTGAYAAYVFNSGGTITIDGGTFTGSKAAIQADATQNASASVIVNDGTFNGDVKTQGAGDAKIEISNGTFTADVTKFLAEGSQAVATTDAQGNTVYMVVPPTNNAVALVGTTYYDSLTEAFAAAEAGQTISLLKDCEATALISVDKDMVLDLNGYELTNNVTGSRLFRLSGVNFTIENGKITTPETNTGSYGIVDFRDPSNVASPDANLTVKDVIVSGDTDDGSMFAIRTNGQTITLDNVTATMPGKTLNYSILNAYNLQVNATINGGTFEHGSTRKSMPAFQFGRNSNFTINGSKVISHSGPVFEASACTGVVTDCDMVCDNTSGNFNDACVAVSNGSDVTVKGGTYTGAYAAYVFNSGGTITIDGGTFTGSKAAIQADATQNASASVVVNDGTFYGALVVNGPQDNAKITLKGGSYDAKNVEEFCADNFHPVVGEDGMTRVEAGVSSVVDAFAPGAVASEIQGVYNFNGVRVADSAEGLAPGLYIINGKKTMIK